MLRALHTWLIRKRFERYFVKPYAAAKAEARALHKEGVTAAYEMQKAAVHRALGWREVSR